MATLVAVLAATAILPMSGARAAGKIEFLNPSGFTTKIDLSDKIDKDSAYHLVAWVGAVPANPLVEFEITSVTLGTTTVDASRVATDTWETFLQLSSFPDGQYTLTARLYRDFTGPGTGQEEAVSATRSVTINRDEIPPPPANTAEITYPSNGAGFGLYAPKGKRVNGLIDAIVSEGTAQVRALYSTSPPGTAPAWVQCGSSAIAESNQVSGPNTVRIKCTLEDGVAGAQVTAVAVVANDSPPLADPNPVADATGDAHRVSPYTQIPGAIGVTPESAVAELAQCFQFTASLVDQNGRPIAGANLDVHAVGPDDQIRFGVIKDITSDYQAPDKGHVSNTRPGINCTDGKNAAPQGDHNIPGANDPQHIESIAGSNLFGKFVFAVHSANVGGTRIDVWSDDDDDDLQQLTETSAGARLGWGQPPPVATREVFLDPSSGSAQTGTCQRMVAVGKIGGSPLDGENVDVHVSGPDETVNFCLPADASPGRPPNAGTHTGNSDDAITRHLEGEFDSSGRFIFGVTSATEGSTNITVWVDSLDDDVLGSDEASRVGSVMWAISGARSISISSSRSSVPKGKRVTISGAISGAQACESGQVVKLRSKPVSSGSFRTIKTDTTTESGRYSFSVRVRASKKYRAIAPAAGACARARSRIITVRAT